MSGAPGVTVTEALAGLAREAASKIEVAECGWESGMPDDATASALLAINYTLERIALMLEVLMEQSS